MEQKLKNQTNKFSIEIKIKVEVFECMYSLK